MLRQQGRTAGRVLRGVLPAIVVMSFSGCGHDPVGPTPVPCSYQLSAEGQSFSPDGGPGSVTVATGASCAWSVEGATGWVAGLSTTSGVGPGPVRFSVQPNEAETGRALVLTVATLPFRITQEGRAPCTYSIAPEQQTFTDEGGSAQAAVTAPAGCRWTATSQAAWIAITSGAEGQGAGGVTYAVAPNNGTTSRRGTLTIATRTLSVEQAGEEPPAPIDCHYAVEPVHFEPCMAAGQVTAAVTTEQGCAWTATPSASWLRLPSGTSGSGPGVIAITFTDNYDAPRDGIVMVRWPTPTAGQNVRVEQAGCLYAVSRDRIDFPSSAAGSGAFDVTQQAVPNTCGGPTQDRCVWTARSSVSWITITSSMPRTGDDPVFFDVAANTGSASRTGTITVRDKSVTVTQAGS